MVFKITAEHLRDVLSHPLTRFNFKMLYSAEKKDRSFTVLQNINNKSYTISSLAEFEPTGEPGSFDYSHNDNSFYLLDFYSNQTGYFDYHESKISDLVELYALRQDYLKKKLNVRPILGLIKVGCLDMLLIQEKTEQSVENDALEVIETFSEKSKNLDAKKLANIVEETSNYNALVFNYSKTKIAELDKFTFEPVILKS